MNGKIDEIATEQRIGCGDFIGNPVIKWSNDAQSLRRSRHAGGEVDRQIELIACNFFVDCRTGEPVIIADVARALAASPIERPLKRLQQGNACRIWCGAVDTRQNNVVILAQCVGKPDVPPAQTSLVVSYGNSHVSITSLCPSLLPRPAANVSFRLGGRSSGIHAQRGVCAKSHENRLYANWIGARGNEHLSGQRFPQDCATTAKAPIATPHEQVYRAVALNIADYSLARMSSFDRLQTAAAT